MPATTPEPPGRPREPRVPFAEMIGRAAEEVAAVYRDDGFDVQLVDVARTTAMTLEYRHGRIRLLVRDGRVVDAVHG